MPTFDKPITLLQNYLNIIPKTDEYKEIRMEFLNAIKSILIQVKQDEWVNENNTEKS
jgi:hypothetical protein